MNNFFQSISLLILIFGGMVLSSVERYPYEVTNLVESTEKTSASDENEKKDLFDPGRLVNKITLVTTDASGLDSEMYQSQHCAPHPPFVDILTPPPEFIELR
jgi:hypothetical protein